MAAATNVLSDEEIARKILDVGFSRERAVVAFAILVGESGLNAWAINLVSHNPEAESYLSLDLGIAQFNTFWHPNYLVADLFDPDYAIKAFFDVSKDGENFKWWVAFSNFSFVRHIARAYEAFAAIGEDV